MKIKLHKPHTHAGCDYLSGDVIECDAPAAQWLIDHGIGQPLEQAQPKPNVAPTTTKRKE